ncbi:MAG: hypothetical protein Q4P06_04750 [Actinomycetaceae bacterium]|nr:hypothetical protein [Actinomycetaceae bacterium]
MDVNEFPSSTAAAIPSWMLSTFVSAAQELDATCSRDQLVELAQSLILEWNDPNRCFHTCSYLRGAIARIDEFSPASHNPAALHLALWFYGVGLHYPLATSDASAVASSQARCCDLISRSLLPIGISQQVCNHLCALVGSAITRHSSPNDLDTAVLVDAILAVLASKPQDYKQLRLALRRERADLSDAEFSHYRREYLHSLLQRPRIFTSPLASMWETQARHNIEGELATLDSQVPLQDLPAREDGSPSLPKPASFQREAPAAVVDERDAPVPVDSSRSASEPTPEMSSLEMVPELLLPTRRDAPRRLSAKEQARASRASEQGASS